MNVMDMISCDGLSRFDRVNPMNLTDPDATAGFPQRSIP